MFYCWVPPVRQGVLLKLLADTECHLTLFARYAKDEIPDEIDGDDNLDNEPAQIPNRKATDVVEASSLNDTVLRPGYLSEGDEDDAVLTVKGEAAKGYTTSIPALVKFAKMIPLRNISAVGSFLLKMFWNRKNHRSLITEMIFGARGGT